MASLPPDIATFSPCPLPFSRVLHFATLLPKAQIHLHLDGSLLPSFLLSHSPFQPLPHPLPSSPSRLRPYLLSLKSPTPTPVAPHANWPVFDILNLYLQTASALQSAVSHLLEYLLSLNVRLIEIRFCPSLHTLDKLTAHDAVEAVVRAFEQGVHGKGIRGGVIVVALRSKGLAHVTEMVHLAHKWHGKGVIGLDIAGDEDAYPLRLFQDVLKQAKLPLTLHAGEWGKEGKENIRIALNIGALRIGHGLAMAGDNDLADEVQRKGVFVETCVSANCVGRGKVEKGRYDMHPVRWMRERGVRVAGWNCDNLMLSGTENHRMGVVEEIVTVRIKAGVSWQAIGEVIKDAGNASFDDMAGDEQRANWQAQFEQDVNRVIQQVVLEEQEYIPRPVGDHTGN